jgi:hypothetical protein
VNGGREAARDRMDGIDGEESEPAGDVYLRDTSVFERAVKKHKNDVRPSSWSESNNPSIVPFETIHVCLEFIGSNDAEWDKMYPGGERVGG